MEKQSLLYRRNLKQLVQNPLVPSPLPPGSQPQGHKCLNQSPRQCNSSLTPKVPRPESYPRDSRSLRESPPGSSSLRYTTHHQIMCSTQFRPTVFNLCPSSLHLLIRPLFVCLEIPVSHTTLAMLCFWIESARATEASRKTNNDTI